MKGIEKRFLLNSWFWEYWQKYIPSLAEAQNLFKKTKETPTFLFGGDKDTAQVWGYMEYLYVVSDPVKLYTHDQIKLLIYGEYDKERKHFEKLKKLYESSAAVEEYKRPRIPEEVRILVWRRDGGKCARCGSREKLEYDHIVPLSQGGSNTARNIELLCEKCNRSKGGNIV